MSSVVTHIDEQGVARVRLARPEKHNAFDDAVIARLHDAFTAIAKDEHIRVMVLESAGKSFSAGADLDWMRRMADYSSAENLADAQALAAMLQRLNTLPQPTIARVQGAAYGGAVGLVCCCDLALGSQQARFSLSEVKIGLIPATISPYVIAALGQRTARRLFLTAEVLDAQQALALGLLSECCDADALDARVAAAIDSLLANGPCAVRAAKQLVLDYAGHPIDADIIEDSCQRIADVRASSEGQAGLRAFLEKTPAPWTQQDV